jgi:hypothetical protein
MGVSFTEIEETEGRTDFVGEEGSLVLEVLSLRCTWEIQPVLFSK